MIIGIDASRAFIEKRTGIEEYSYQVIKNLRNKLDGHRVVLYVRRGQSATIADGPLSFPSNWKIKIINCPRLWTQIGLSLEMFWHPVDVLFVPAHTVPIIHPKNTIVTIHGLEYETVPQGYSRWERFYMRLVIKNSCKWANQIISVSRNTKQDLINLYKVDSEKIQVIYEGYEDNFKFQISNFKSNPNDQISNFKKYKPYLLFIGRLEMRKNIIGIIKTFEILKEKYNIPHKLVLAGKGGHDFFEIDLKIRTSKYKDEIILPGFVKDEDKFALIAGADVFMFPTFYEGFGIPALEAQSVGVPVVTSNLSSMPEVVGNSAILVDPTEPEFIAQRTHDLLSDNNLRDDIIKKGYENVRRFSWEECAEKIANVIENESEK